MERFRIYRTVGDDTNSFEIESVSGYYALRKMVDRDMHLMGQLDIAVSVVDVKPDQVILNYGDQGIVYTL